MSDYIDTTFDVEGNTFPLRILTGVVIDTETRSDTHVYGGGSYGSGNNAHIASVSSYVSVTKDVWLRFASGKEERFQFGDLAIRPGHILQISFFTASFGKALKAKTVRHIIYNVTTDIYWVLPDFPEGRLYNSTTTNGRNVMIQKESSGCLPIIFILGLSPALAFFFAAMIGAVLKPK